MTQIDLTEFGEKEMLSQLDAYGHLCYAFTDTDRCICADFIVWYNADRGLLIGYEVIFDDDFSSSLDRVECGVFPVEELGLFRDLDWCPLIPHLDFLKDSRGDGEITEEDIYAVKQRWKKAVESEIHAVLGGQICLS